MRPTPGVVGYAVAVEVSVAAGGLTLGLTQGLAVTEVLGWLFALTYVQLLALPLAPVGVLVVHLPLRRVQAQWLHVLATGSVALVPALLFASYAAPGIEGLRHPVPVAVAVGLGAALGRALVAPGLRDRLRSRSGSAGRRSAAAAR